MYPPKPQQIQLCSGSSSRLLRREHEVLDILVAVGRLDHVAPGADLLADQGFMPGFPDLFEVEIHERPVAAGHR